MAIHIRKKRGRPKCISRMHIRKMLLQIMKDMALVVAMKRRRFRSLNQPTLPSTTSGMPMHFTSPVISIFPFPVSCMLPTTAGPS